jgi:hypothetical protein
MKNFSWGHGIVIALAAFIIFILSMMFLFTNGQKNSEMVTDNYYEEELKYQDVIDAKKEPMIYRKNLYTSKINQNYHFFPKDYDNSNTTVKFVLNRTDDQNLDIHKAVQLDANKSFTIPSQVLRLGNYTLRLTWTKDKTDYRMDYDVIWK